MTDVLRRIAFLLVLGVGGVTSSCATLSPANAPLPGPSPLGSPNSFTAVLELRSSERGPSATFAYGGSIQKGYREEFCWDPTPGGKSDGFCEWEEGTGIPSESIEIPAETILKVTGDADGVEGGIGAFVVEDGHGEVKIQKRLDLADGSAVIDVQPGEHAMEFEAKWPQGSSFFEFRIRVVD